MNGSWESSLEYGEPGPFPPDRDPVLFRLIKTPTNAEATYRCDKCDQTIARSELARASRDAEPTMLPREKPS